MTPLYIFTAIITVCYIATAIMLHKSHKMNKVLLDRNEQLLKEKIARFEETYNKRKEMAGGIVEKK